MSQQAVSAKIIRIQLLKYFPQKQKEQRHKQLGCTYFMLPTHTPYTADYLQSHSDSFGNFQR